MPRSGSGWASTPARASSTRTARTSATTSTGRPASPARRTAARSSSRRRSGPWPAATLPAGVTLRDLGEHRLKDLRPEPLTQLVIDGLQADFPPVRSLDQRPNNLPTQLTSFVGREHELEAASALLAGDPPPDAHRARRDRQDPPGAPARGGGRRRLPGRRLVRRPGAAPRRRPWSCPRWPGRSASTQRATETALDALVAAVGERRMLLVLDNFEHVIDAAGEIGGSPPGLPGRAKVVVTSRAVLRISGEQEYVVPGLPAPPDTSRLSRVELENLPAARPPPRSDDPRAVRGGPALHRPRGGGPPDFAVTNDNAPAVAGICARLQGMPLAIELAAARVKLLAPEQILDRLERQLSLLTSTARDLPGPPADAARRDRVELRPARRAAPAAPGPPLRLPRRVAARGRRGGRPRGGRARHGRPRRADGARRPEPRPPLRRNRTAPRASTCSRPSASSPPSCSTRAMMPTPSGPPMPHSSWPLPSGPPRSSRAPSSAPGSTAWSATTTTCGPRWGGPSDGPSPRPRSAWCSPCGASGSSAATSWRPGASSMRSPRRAGSCRADAGRALRRDLRRGRLLAGRHPRGGPLVRRRACHLAGARRGRRPGRPPRARERPVQPGLRHGGGRPLGRHERSARSGRERQAMLEEALAIYRELGDETGEGNVLWGLGGFEIYGDDPAEAERWFRRARGAASGGRAPDDGGLVAPHAQRDPDRHEPARRGGGCVDARPAPLPGGGRRGRA